MVISISVTLKGSGYTFHTKPTSRVLDFGLMDVRLAPREARVEKHVAYENHCRSLFGFSHIFDRLAGPGVAR